MRKLIYMFTLFFKYVIYGDILQLPNRGKYLMSQEIFSSIYYIIHSASFLLIGVTLEMKAKRFDCHHKLQYISYVMHIIQCGELTIIWITYLIMCIIYQQDNITTLLWEKWQNGLSLGNVNICILMKPDIVAI